MSSNFYGYSTFDDVVAAHGFEVAQHLLSIAQKKHMRVCNTHAKCRGSMDGVFMYADGSKDTGRDIPVCAAVTQQGKFAWSQP